MNVIQDRIGLAFRVVNRGTHQAAVAPEDPEVTPKVRA